MNKKDQSINMEILIETIGGIYHECDSTISRKEIEFIIDAVPKHYRSDEKDKQDRINILNLLLYT